MPSSSLLFSSLLFSLVFNRTEPTDDVEGTTQGTLSWAFKQLYNQTGTISIKNVSLLYQHCRLDVVKRVTLL